MTPPEVVPDFAVVVILEVIFCVVLLVLPAVAAVVTVLVAVVAVSSGADAVVSVSAVEVRVLEPFTPSSDVETSVTAVVCLSSVFA